MKKNENYDATTDYYDEIEVRENTKNESLVKLAKRLSECLKDNGYTANSFSKKHGVSKSSICQYLKGKQVPNAVQLLTFSEHLHVSVDYLLGISELKSTDDNFKIVHSLTGLSDKAIQGLKEYYDNAKILGFDTEKDSRMRDFRTINYLLSDHNGFQLFNSLTNYLWFKEIYKKGINSQTKIIDDDTNFEFIMKEQEEIEKIRIDKAIYRLKDEIDESLDK